jgi:hypothetical protein
MMLAGKGIIKRENSQASRESAEASTLLTRIFGFGFIFCGWLRAELLFSQSKEFFGLRDDRASLSIGKTGD